jgi:antitoxin (DNA-binding transcriptional repressor) of toxin-antitoxin stability system
MSAMRTVALPDAEADLYRLVEAVEIGAETEIVIARDGRPVARLLPFAARPPVGRRVGAAKGLWRAPDPDAALDDAAAANFDLRQASQSSGQDT